LVPQLAGPLSWQTPFGSATPGSIGQHAPSRDGNTQETHGPWQAMLQQTLLAQNPDRQSALAVQAPPLRRFPQLPAASQACPSTHWPFALHFL
jgi:hypothetical protein